VVRTRSSRTAVEAARREEGASAPVTPPCRLDVGQVAGRTSARAVLPLADLQRVRRAAGVSLNDVALAVVAGALREQLLADGALPEQPLTSGVPVALDPPGAPVRTSGNCLGGFVTSLATDVEDPWSRLLAISQGTRTEKRLLALGDPGLLLEWLDVLPPGLLRRGVRKADEERAADPDGAPGANVVVSNVRGLRGPRVLLGRPVEEYCLTGPPNGGVGVNVVLQDSGDQVFLGLVCVADPVADAGALAARLRPALAALVAGARERSASAA
ncbi:MAG: conserved hypothetical rane protein, partial [Frankiales bacterium]|nr:conserved hypothetical rane protein [Frankiales bacterium]